MQNNEIAAELPRAITVRLPSSEAQRLEQAARDHYRSASSEVRSIINSYFATAESEGEHR